jgi:branched-chain amino acid transport system substrate-binding protein
MLPIQARKGFGLLLSGMLAVASGFVAPLTAAAQDKEPIKIGFSMALTGGLAGAGKSALIGMQIWEDDTNKAGGLLGRPVKLIYYDDQTNPSTVPGLYTKLLDVDKVDLIVSGYGTNMIAPAMPIAIQRGKVLPGLGGLAVNEEYHYDKYFQISPMGPSPRQDWSRGYFELAKAQGFKTLAIVAADAEFAQNAAEGARRNAKEFGMELLYDQSYPPATADYTPILRAVKAANPEVVFVASYPPDSAGIIRALAEVGLGGKTQMFGGSMVGPAYVSLANTLGAKMNGIVNFDLYVAEPTMKFPGIDEFLAKYQPIAKQQGVDPLGHYLAPWGYAYLQVLAAGVAGTNSLDDAAIAKYIHEHEIATVVGPVRFNQDGEWAKSRMLMVQYKGLKEGEAMEMFGKPGARQILYPPEYKTGEWLPYAKAR